MRWPWSRRAPEPAAPAARTPDPTPPAPTPAPPSPMGWAFLPPIQRTLATPVETVTRPTAFPTELTAWRSPSFTSSLSHAVVDTAPAGVIDGDGGGLRGTGLPSTATGPGPELTLLPPPRPTAVQRSVRSSSPAARPAVAPEAPSLTRAPAAGMPVVHRAVVDDPLPLAPPEAETEPEAGVAAEPEAGVAAEPEEAPDAVDEAPPAAEPPAAVHADHSGHAVPPSPAKTAPVLGTTAATPTALQRSATTDPPPVPDSFDRTDRVATPLAPRPESFDRTDGVPESAGSAHESFDRTDRAGGTAAAPTVAPTSPPTIQRSRPRLGFGPPLMSVPATAVAGPPAPAPAPVSTSSPDLPVGPAGGAGFTEVPVQRTAAAPPSTPDRSSSATSTPSAPPTAAPTPAPGPTPPPELVLGPTPSAPAADEPPVRHATEPTPSSDPEPVAVAVAVEPATTPDTEPATDAAPETTPMHQVALEPPGVLPAPPLTVASVPLLLGPGMPTSIQRSTVLPGPGTPSPSLVVRPAPLLPAPPSRERVVPIQRLAAEPPQPARPRSTPTVQRTPARAAAPAPAVATELTVARATSAPDLLPSPAATRAPVAPTPPPPSLTLARSVDTATTSAATTHHDVGTPGQGPAAGSGEAPESDGLVVARADEGEPAGGGETTATAAPGLAAARAGGGGGSGGAAGAAGGGDVEAMAHQLFPPLLRRLKNELLLDRERRGSRTDAW